MKNKEQELENQKEVVDELSAEAIFAKMRRPEDTKTKASAKKPVVKKVTEEKKAKPAKEKKEKPPKEKKEKPKKKKDKSDSEDSMDDDADDDDDEEVAPKKKTTRSKKKETSTKNATDLDAVKKKPAKKAAKKIIDEEEISSEHVLASNDIDEIAVEVTEKPVKASKKASSKKSKSKDSESEIESDPDDRPADPNVLKTPKPLFELDADGSLPKLPKYAFKMLQKDFGHKCFKAHQEEAVTRIACGLSTIVVLSTGYGKSLIYQFAAKLYARTYPGSLVLVVSPLISLMQDQLHNLPRSLKAAVCDSQMVDKDYQQMLQDLANGKINILFMSPEAIINKKIRNLPRLAFVCIDEVHCLSQWSHNFRPSYLQLGQVIQTFIN